jgi:hypothetical protein
MFGRVLAWRPVVFAGLISYSLYLWHWPVLAFAHYGYPSKNLPDLSVSTRLLPLVVAVALAVVSWRWIEVPFRKKRIARNRRTVFGLAAAVTALVMVAGGSIALSRGFPSRMATATEVARLNAAALDDTGFRDNVEIADVVAGRLPRLGNVDPDAPVRVLLWGDSHAMHVAAALDEFCRSRGVAGEIVACHSKPPVLDAVLGKRSHLGKNATVWADAVLQHIRKTGIRDVLLAARWGGYERNNPRLLETALRETIRRLTAEAGCRVLVLQDTPDVDVVVPRILVVEALAASSSWVWGNRGEWRRTEEQHRRKNSVIYRLAGQASLEKIPARFIDPAPALLEPDGHYRADQDGVSLYFDDDHLTTRGSLLVLLPLLEAAMGDVIRE